jgi:hypothetical protein
MHFKKGMVCHAILKLADHCMTFLKWKGLSSDLAAMSEAGARPELDGRPSSASYKLFDPGRFKVFTFCVPSGMSSGLRGRRRTYHTILKLADHNLFKMVW